MKSFLSNTYAHIHTHTHISDIKQQQQVFRAEAINKLHFICWFFLFILFVVCCLLLCKASSFGLKPRYND